ncbi:MAG: transposase family protein [Phormidesmis sp. CAN_BIN44]|nr:transposase family protein [Phormidesmis sp. CAN_BIN44]
MGQDEVKPEIARVIVTAMSERLSRRRSRESVSESGTSRSQGESASARTMLNPLSEPRVYRILKPLIEKANQPKRSLGWRGSRLLIATREGLEIGVEWSNQVWQCDHTKIDLLVVDQAGSLLGRPWLTIMVDTYSRCIMGIHLGFDALSAFVVCLALRHAILPKQYPAL